MATPNLNSEETNNCRSNSIPNQASNFSRQNADVATVCVYGLSLLSAATFIFLPLVNFLHPSPWQRYMNGLHGLAAMLATVVVVYAGHLAFPLLRRKPGILPQMRTLSFWATLLALLAVISGIWIYARYRAPSMGARAWLQENTPLVHYLHMEYHEFTVLFTVPLGTACTWILWRYGDSIFENRHRAALSICAIGLMSMMFFGLGGFISGMGVAKIHGL